MCFEYYESSINACIQYKDADGVYELINKANNDKIYSRENYLKKYFYKKQDRHKVCLVFWRKNDQKVRKVG